MKPQIVSLLNRWFGLKIVAQAHSPHGQITRRTGRISHVHWTRKFGEIRDAATGLSYFVHWTQIRGGTLREGLTVCFTPTNKPKGPAAENVSVLRKPR